MRRNILLIFTIIYFAASSCNSGVEVRTKPKTPEELRAELETHEKAHPLNYLMADSTELKPNRVKVKDNWFRSDEYETKGYHFNCSIVNNATIAKFKDVVLRISYYSQTRSLIATKELTIYEYFEPRSNKRFKELLNPPDDMSAYDVAVISAIPVY